MKFEKIIFVLCFLPVQIFAFFADVQPDDPDLSLIVKYEQQNCLRGEINENGEKIVNLKNLVTKKEACLNFACALGVENPSIEDVQKMEICGELSDENLDFAIIAKIATNALKIPTEKTEIWYEGPMKIATEIGAIDEKNLPKNSVTRREMIKIIDTFLKNFRKTNDEKIGEQEKNLMKMRDFLVDEKTKNDEIEILLLENLIGAEKIESSEKFSAIQNLNSTIGQILQIRKNPNSKLNERRRELAQIFLQNSIENFPDVAPFSSDLEAILCIMTDCPSLVIPLPEMDEPEIDAEKIDE